jgi:hypothetical protein
MDFTDGLQPTADDATTTPSGGSLWSSAPGLLAGLATLVGSLVGLATVLVQAGVIGASSAPAPVRTTTAPLTTAAIAPSAAPELDRALDRLDALLAESARTKGNLGALVAAVQARPPAVSRATALNEIDRIITQREGLRHAIAAFAAPATLLPALALLRDSITVSLADDRLVRQWIVARFDGDPAESRLWQAQLEESRQATSAKSAFRAVYTETLRSRGRPGVVPDY